MEPSRNPLGAEPSTNLLGTQHWLDADRHADAVTDSEVVVLRIAESLYFANAPALRDSIERAHTRHSTRHAARQEGVGEASCPGHVRDMSGTCP